MLFLCHLHLTVMCLWPTDRQTGAEVSLKLGIALQGFCLSAGRHRGEGPIIILENPHRDFEPCLTFSKYPLMLWR